MLILPILSKLSEDTRHRSAILSGKASSQSRTVCVPSACLILAKITSFNISFPEMMTSAMRHSGSNKLAIMDKIILFVELTGISKLIWYLKHSLFGSQFIPKAFIGSVVSQLNRVRLQWYSDGIESKTLYSMSSRKNVVFKYFVHQQLLRLRE